ncbi:hypothetical protein [Fischerella sp.]|uniref:hypothetical protein n=1 Tax=Fischerella sp. TaxID=1191 RepID=UPI0025C37B3D|nr:hypothetical protein [Fischerella sp.]
MSIYSDSTSYIYSDRISLPVYYQLTFAVLVAPVVAIFLYKILPIYPIEFLRICLQVYKVFVNFL